MGIFDGIKNYYYRKKQEGVMTINRDIVDKFLEEQLEVPTPGSTQATLASRAPSQRDQVVERFGKFGEILNTWEPASDVLFLRYGAIGSSCFVSSFTLLLSSHFIRCYKVPKYKWLVHFACGGVGALAAYAASKHSTNLLVDNRVDCLPCFHIKTGFNHWVASFAFPFQLGLMISTYVSYIHYCFPHPVGYYVENWGAKDSFKVYFKMLRTRQFMFVLGFVSIVNLVFSQVFAYKSVIEYDNLQRIIYWERSDSSL